jgi:hypothetical protein
MKENVTHLERILRGEVRYTSPHTEIHMQIYQHHRPRSTSYISVGTGLVILD